jgi:hypothetical protein
MKDMREIMARIGLTVNEEKTKLYMPEGSFTFLGYEFRTLYSWKWHKKYIGMRPAQKAITKLTETIRQKTAANKGLLDASVVVKAINRVVRGWANYYNVGSVSKAYKGLSRYIIGRFRQWMRRKKKTKGYKRFSHVEMYRKWNLFYLMGYLPDYS